ncbi:serine/threonine protein kinase (plasmid) [Tundrisphaera lichenicola]|uniref:serine/threonine protein kinase n=1 Tax=Tundrisphaera lichenicola TaxID=2029860 RepID=UPI003EB72DC8
MLQLLEELTQEHRRASDPCPLSGPFGRYEILDEIDRGASSIVYLATDPNLDRLVALKVALPETIDDPERLRRFELEGTMVSRLDHPNIIRVHGAGIVAEIPYLAMDYVEGETLADWLLKDQTITSRQASRLVREIAGAIGHVHDRGVLNLDLKPRNIMLCPSVSKSPDDLGSIPMIIDFGLARLFDEGDESFDGMSLVGTPPYLAPEQVREGSGKCGMTADVYALGIILYELLVGWPPFLGKNRLNMIRALLEDEPIPPSLLRPDVPPMLEAICLRCLEKLPDRRYATARDLYDDLGRFLDNA